LVEADILERSAELFAARGFAATSMQDIAGALGVSRPSLYHYFDSKEAIMLRLVEGLAASTEAAIAGVLKTDTPPDRKLRALVTALIAPIAESPGRFRLLLTSDASVGLSGTGRLRNLERAVVRSIASVIADGVEAGLFRRVDQHAATFSVLGMINWIAWWYPAGKALPIDELCVTIADLALASLRANDAHGGGESPHEILAGIRRDLGHLERALDAPETGK
jgi:AcrR family transcriptional regulator